jgi:hypothetical protein
MKYYSAVLAACALGLSIIIIGVFTISTFNYIAFLKEQNYSLLGNINYSIYQLKESVRRLESEERLVELASLKSANVVLKKEAEKLRDELNRLCEKRQRKVITPLKGQEKQPCKNTAARAKEDTNSGNRGFLLKEGSPQ